MFQISFVLLYVYLQIEWEEKKMRGKIKIAKGFIDAPSINFIRKKTASLRIV